MREFLLSPPFYPISTRLVRRLVRNLELTLFPFLPPPLLPSLPSFLALILFGLGLPGNCSAAAEEPKASSEEEAVVAPAAAVEELKSEEKVAEEGVETKAAE